MTLKQETFLISLLNLKLLSLVFIYQHSVTLSIRLILVVCSTHVKMSCVSGQGVCLVFECCWEVRFFIDEHFIFHKL